jgi:hypothetical protein
MQVHNPQPLLILKIISILIIHRSDRSMQEEVIEKLTNRSIYLNVLTLVFKKRYDLYRDNVLIL